MPRYYELDVICEVFSDILHISERDIEEILENAPTEDVVLRSEFEKLSIELEAMRGVAKSYKMHYDNAKQDVAREIFVELENIIIDHHTTPFGLEVLVIGDAQFNNLKKKHIGE